MHNEFKNLAKKWLQTWTIKALCFLTVLISLNMKINMCTQFIDQKRKIWKSHGIIVDRESKYFKVINHIMFTFKSLIDLCI